MALHTGDSVTCTVCNRKFDSADSLAMHAAVHTDLVPSQSPTPPDSTSTPHVTETVCGLTGTTTMTTMTATMATTVDSNDSQKPYQCQHCGRRFTRPHEKVKHERIHTGEKPHACEVSGCGKIKLKIVRY